VSLLEMMVEADELTEVFFKARRDFFYELDLATPANPVQKYDSALMTEALLRGLIAVRDHVRGSSGVE